MTLTLVMGALLWSLPSAETQITAKPGIDGRNSQPSLFDGITDKKDFLPVQLDFKEISTFPNGVVWIRYKVTH